MIMKDNTYYASEAHANLQAVTIEDIKNSAFGMIRAASKGGRSFVDGWWVKDEKLKQAIDDLTSLGYICLTDGKLVERSMKVRITW